MLAGIFGIKPADPVDDYPDTLPEFLQKYPTSQIAYWHQQAQKKAARVAALDAERRPLQERVRRCKTLLAEATPASDFVALAAAKVELEVLEREIDRIGYELSREGSNNADAKAHNLWGSYTVRLADAKNHRETARPDWNDRRPSLADKLKLLKEAAE